MSLDRAESARIIGTSIRSSQDPLGGQQLSMAE
jgi:hypothetical protein